ncbi:M61 family peptidase, partial [Fulvivirga sp. RKSG066]|uniref:M61 family metallopeptidase n=1 Tax=Fulvivirga aurantia TaxID=2529383 RepID=UPI0012BC64FC
MQYTIHLANPLEHLLEITLSLSAPDDTLELVLPLWRPGRYEAANYSKNLRSVSFFDDNDTSLSYDKTDANRWTVDTRKTKNVTVKYEYYAFAMDAGNSYYDEELIYINFINCLMYSPKTTQSKCKVSINIPSEYEVACALSNSHHVFESTDFYELVDSPLMASKNIDLKSYNVGETQFNIWVYGVHNIDLKQLTSDFKKFSEAQISSLGEFPEDEYHFLLLILPYKHYHGVEHAKSTVICLGPGNEVGEGKLYSELLGVSSHELFHAWNIIKIRPKEMMPYDFSREVTFPTGLVAEGFTTYYGDLYLCRGKVFDTQWYFDELNTLFNRHFWNYGRLNESVITSSLNLWIDGYVQGAPHKKSSIYVEGAMIALCLDLIIRKQTSSEKSLDDVLHLLWEKHGKTQVGYSLEEIKLYCEAIYGESLDAFFKDYVFGARDKYDLVDELLGFVGCNLVQIPNENFLTRYLGLRGVSNEASKLKILQIAPGSIGQEFFSVNDEINSIDGNKPEEYKPLMNEPSVFEIRRNSRERVIEVSIDPNLQYYHNHIIEKQKQPT